MMPFIKICGLRHPDEVSLCEELGVTFIGLNFVPSSPRSVTLAQAAEMLLRMRHCRPVAVFTHQDAEFIESVCEEIDVQFVQMHGAGEQVPVLKGRTIIRALRYVPDQKNLGSLQKQFPYLLLDGTKNGQKADWKAIAEFPEDVRRRIFLAGGLNPENVAEAISMIHPFAVDVASGVESEPGVKDPDLIRAFVAAVQQSSSSLSSSS